RMIYRPDPRKAEREAYKLLIMLNATQLPLKVKSIEKYFPNLKIKTYEWLAKKRNLSIYEVYEFAQSDEGCCWYNPATHQYMILYNNDSRLKLPTRQRWTIAHELGHFILRHNEIMGNKAIIARNNLTDDEYEALETEADCFARSLLAPPYVLSKINIRSAHD